MGYPSVVSASSSTRSHTPSRTRMGPCFLERLSGGAGVSSTAILGRGGDFVADYIDLICGLPLIGLLIHCFCNWSCGLPLLYLSRHPDQILLKYSVIEGYNPVRWDSVDIR